MSSTKPATSDFETLIPANLTLYRLARVVKKSRTKVGFLAAGIALVGELMRHSSPLALEDWSLEAFLALALLLAGLTFRLAALGTIRKNETLATTGVYARCRHPLYLGSILLIAGIGVLMQDPWNLLIAAIYLLAFYPLTIVWEERLLRFQFGEAHEEYCAATPLLLPFGLRSPGEFTWRRAVQQGAMSLILVVVSVVALLELLARWHR